MKRILILSDGKMGHLNQSIAFAKYMALPYDVVQVTFSNKLLKILSYVFDTIGIYTQKLFNLSSSNISFSLGNYSMVVGAGSSTYYTTKVLAKKLLATSVTMMLPKGYRYNFDVIFAQKHDMPPKQDNIKLIPANFSYSEAKDIFKPTHQSIGVIIGGDNKLFKVEKSHLKEQLDIIVEQYAKKYDIAITTSPRTSKEIEALVSSYEFDYEVIFSDNPVNPIADFLTYCEYVFITMDSTSMISEAVSYGKANVVILPLSVKKDNKYRRFVESLEKEGYLHIFDGTIKSKSKKISFANYVESLAL